jgi:hypothetical protein
LRLTILAALAAAILAAVAAHVGIDVAGDYLLPDDSYDHVAHGSRELFTIAALLCACGAGTLLMQRMLSAVASLPARVRLLRMPRRKFAGAAAAVSALALFIVPLMETFDAIRGGGDIDSLADAFGGSLLLGAGITLACALAVCAAVIAVLAWLCRHRDHVARFVGSLIARAQPAPRVEFAQRARRSLLTRAREHRAQRRSKRGPPTLRLRTAFIS